MTINIEFCNKSVYGKGKCYTVTIFGKPINTVLTHDPGVVDKFISHILFINRHRFNGLIVGLDIEWSPNSMPNVEIPPAILQLCVGNMCLIFQTFGAWVKFPSVVSKQLVNFLSNPAFRFVGVGIQRDVDKLRRFYDLHVTNSVDLPCFAAVLLNRVELRNYGLKGLAKEVLNMEIDKPKEVTMSKWDVPCLTYDQVQYACVDAFLSLAIAEKLILGY